MLMLGRSNRTQTVRTVIGLVLAAVGAGLASGPEAFAGPPPGGEGKIPAITIPSEHQWGANGAGPGQFLDVTGLTLGPDGNAYVADCDVARVQVMTVQGEFVRQIGGPAASEGGLRCPRDVAVTAEGRRVYVLDSADGRVLEYDHEGMLAGTGVSDPTTDGTLMVVTDPGTESVRFYRGGRALSRCGTSGSTPGRFARPRGVSLDGAGRAYVADQQTTSGCSSSTGTGPTWVSSAATGSSPGRS
jgi:DNA-binding beta-propeller fold protein YncE